MMNRWFRFYADAMRNPKVLKLTDKEFRLWVRMLAVASENDGAIPALDDLRLILNMRLDHLSSAVDRLISIGLIDRSAVGYAPHNWDKFQYKSDTSRERVAAHRARRNVTVTPPDTDTDTDVPLSKDNGVIDPEKIMFDSGVALLRSGGKSEAASRSLLGKWKKNQGTAEVIAAIGRAKREGSPDPAAFIEGMWKHRAREPAEGFQI